MTTQHQEAISLTVAMTRCPNGGYILHNSETKQLLAAVSTAPENARVLLDLLQSTFGESPYEHVMPQQILPPVHQPMAQQPAPRPYRPPPAAPPEPMPRVVEEAERRATSKLAEQIAEVQRGNGRANGTFG